jgi:hypothetical protein
MMVSKLVGVGERERLHSEYSTGSLAKRQTRSCCCNVVCDTAAAVWVPGQVRNSNVVQLATYKERRRRRRKKKLRLLLKS